MFFRNDAVQQIRTQEWGGTVAATEDRICPIFAYAGSWFSKAKDHSSSGDASVQILQKVVAQLR
jgi:hypothetical protein